MLSLFSKIQIDSIDFHELFQAHSAENQTFSTRELADPRKGAPGMRLLSVKFLSLSCSFREKFSLVIGCGSSWGLAFPVWEILDPPLPGSLRICHDKHDCSLPEMNVKHGITIDIVVPCTLNNVNNKMANCNRVWLDGPLFINI